VTIAGTLLAATRASMAAVLSYVACQSARASICASETVPARGDGATDELLVYGPTR
jgi:hypothetical protein